MTESNLLAYEVDVHLDVLGVAMMNWVGGEVHSGDIVTKDNHGLVDRTRELGEKLT